MNLMRTEDLARELSYPSGQAVQVVVLRLLDTKEIRRQ